MKVMVVTPYLPHRDVGHGGGTAVRDLVRGLARRHEVLVASLLRPGEAARVQEVVALGVRVETIPFADATARGAARLPLLADRGRAWLRARRSGYPLYVEKYWSPGRARRLADLVRDFAPDAIQVEYLQLAMLARGLGTASADAPAGPRLVLNSHELGSLPRERRAAGATAPGERQRALAEAARWRRLQVDATRWFDRTLCVTDEDHTLYAAMGGEGLVTVPLGVDTEAVTPVWAPGPADPEEHLFVGSFGHRPNRLAARLLVETIWPLVRARRPGARLTLAGRGSRRFLAELPAAMSRDGVTATGFVADLTPLFRRARLFVAPLPEGGGIKIKILEAMARGIPVVTTPVGAEGIAAPEQDALVLAAADAGFADAVCAAADDTADSRARATRARALIEASFSWTAIVDRLTEIYRGD
jgi:glycosyltransferase involved in cell wall biosynthesis